MGVLCVGIDPAPSGRGSAVVELHTEREVGNVRWRQRVPHPELRQDLRRWKEEHESILIAWDAPLTGPRYPDSADAGGPSEPSCADFTMRELERNLRNSIPKDIQGVSVVGYAGCPHWTITRNLLGLPRVGPYDSPSDQLPYAPLFARPEVLTGHRVVEVHPAVAIWEWLRHPEAAIVDWRYKVGPRQDQKTVSASLLDGLETIWIHPQLAPLLKTVGENRQSFVASSDLLDALVAVALAALFVSGSDEVDVRGDSSQGAMLLPVRGS